MKPIAAQPSALSGQVRSPLRRVAFIGGFDDLIARAQRGDRTAFSALMSAHKDDLYPKVRTCASPTTRPRPRRKR